MSGGRTHRRTGGHGSSGVSTRDGRTQQAVANFLSYPAGLRRRRLLSKGATDPHAIVAEIEKILATLTPAEECLLRARFGIGTPKDDADSIRLSPARARRIEARALRQLRADAMRAVSSRR